MDAREALVGQWDVEMTFPDESGLGTLRGATTFAWLLDGAFLLATSTVDHPAAPDGHIVMTQDRQHYFDARGVVREYEMSLTDGVWALERLQDGDFQQRFRADVEADRIVGAWERTEDGLWIHDFDMTYTRKT